MKTTYKAMIHGLGATIIVIIPLVFILHLWEHLFFLFWLSSMIWVWLTYRAYVLLLDKEVKKSIRAMIQSEKECKIIEGW